jgi:adenylate cyclase
VSWPDRLLGLGVPSGLAQSADRTARFVNATTAIVLAYIVLNTAVAVVYATPALMWIQLSHFVLMAMALVLSARGRHTAAAGWFAAVALVYVTVYALVWGWQSHTQFFLPMVLFLTFLLFDPRRWRWTATYSGLIAVSYLGVAIWFHSGGTELITTSDAYLRAQEWLGVVGVLGLSLAFGFYAWFTIRAAERGEAAERARAESLLLNVLPAAIAERLKAGETSIADRFDEVSVLFADVVGFTPMSAAMSPQRSVELLNEVFTGFDGICERHGVEKIKTIGDGYMAVAGAPVRADHHARVLALAALEMRDWLTSLDIPLQVRIGINSGEAVGGIVGRAKFQYDLWGDTVNTAARMESHGEPGRIQIGPATRRTLGNAFECAPRGPIEIKGKGTMCTWWLLAARSGGSDPSHGNVRSLSA